MKDVTISFIKTILINTIKWILQYFNSQILVKYQVLVSMIEEKLSNLEVLKYNEDTMENISYYNLFFINQNKVRQLISWLRKCIQIWSNQINLSSFIFLLIYLFKGNKFFIFIFLFIINTFSIVFLYKRLIAFDK
jgi:hypothetical protein